MMSILTLAVLALAAEVGVEHPITSGSSSRKYILYDPVGNSTPKRVILAFHGFGQEADHLEKDTLLNEAAKREKFVVVYPRSLGRGWNAGNCCGQENDLQFFDDLLADVKKRTNADTSKVYVVGFSNGAMMAYRLAAERPNNIAAAAMLAGSMESVPAHNVPVPILHVHGSADLIVPFDGTASKLPGNFKPSFPTKSAIVKWVAINRSKAPPRETQLAPAPREVTRYDYEPQGTSANVVLITVDNGGHLWPGVKSPTVSPELKLFLGRTNHNIDATSIIIDFFKSHP